MLRPQFAIKNLTSVDTEPFPGKNALLTTFVVYFVCPVILLLYLDKEHLWNIGINLHCYTHPPLGSFVGGEDQGRLTDIACYNLKLC